MDSEVTNNARLLSKAVCSIHSDTASTNDRNSAYQFLENFKDKSNHLCVDCGFMMARKENLDIERHFGLQLLEHAVKFKWQELDIDRKLFVMENTMGLIANGTNDILTERMYIKDALTRILVEMIKKEWPQQWPDLLQKLEMLSALGPTQTELVLFVFLRLAEDIVKFQILPGQRRRDIHQTLNGKMQGIFNFFMTVLDNKVKCYLQLRNSEHEKEKTIAMSNCRVAHTVLLTMTGYVDWVNHAILFESNGTLLSMLCLLLSDEHLQLQAADVLLLIVSRKGKAEERKPLLTLFKNDIMEMIFNAAVQASSKDLEVSHYLFLKTLCQVLVGIGMQLCALWGTENNVGKPDNFRQYLHAILAITGHSSQTVGSYTHPLWVQFLRHSEISKDPDFQSVLPDLMKKSMTSLQKVGYPSQNNAPSCLYSRLDFDSDEEFNGFFSRFRADVSESVRLTTVLLPMMTAELASQWLLSLLEKPLDLGAGADQGHCNLKSPSFIEWDAMTSFLENVQSRLSQSENQVPDVNNGLSLLKTVVGYTTEDPLILSCVLSCISALFQYITHAPDMLPIILNKIFATVVFNIDGQTKSTRIKSVQNVRRHACSIMVKICKNYSSLMVPCFDELCRHVETISSDSENVSQMERCTLMEALILISNQFMNYEKQSRFLGQVLHPVHQFWLSAEFSQSLTSPRDFMRFVGLDQAPVEPGLDDQCGINRSSIANAINTILAAIKRSEWPDEMTAAKQGGFLEDVKGKEILRNPASVHVMGLIDNVFRLLKISNELWLPENQSQHHADFSGAFDLPDVEKQILLGVHPKCIDNTDTAPSKQPVDRMLNFLQLSNDNAYHILGNAGKALRHGFFSAPELVPMILNNVFHCLSSVPDYRIRPLVRSFMKPFVQFCPEEMYQSVCVPVLTVLGRFMVERLNTKWQIIHQRNSAQEDGDDDNPESQEVLEDLLIRQLTREYIELLSDICIVRKTASSNGEASDDVTMDDDAQPSERPNDVSLSELGKLVLKCEGTCEPIVLCLFTSLSWNDTTACHKAIPLCSVVIRQLVGDRCLSTEAAVHLYTAILSGLQLHGQHEASQPLLIGLALNAYLLLRPIFPEIADVMHQIPSCSPTDLKNFDDKLAQPQHQKSSEKKRKDAFKKLVCDVIAKSLAQKFKKEVPIQDLPRLFVEKKLKREPVMSRTEDCGLAILFSDDVN